MNRENTFSLTVMVIVMALLAIFVGYLLGNWLIQLVTGSSPETRQVVDKKIVEEEIIEDEETGEYIYEENDDNNSVNDSVSIIPSQEEESDEEFIKEQLKGEVYVVQVGAFNNRNNAEKLQQELANKGYQAIITEGVPYKVQLGATNDREMAEKTEKEVEALGYDAFITH